MTPALRHRIPQRLGSMGHPAPVRPWIPVLAGWICAVIGAVDIASAVTPELRTRLHDVESVLPLALVNVASALTAVTGVLLLLLSRALRRRKFRAWLSVCLLLASSIVLHILKGLDIEEASGSGAVLVLLLAARREFFASGDPRGRRRAPAVAVALVALDIVAGLGLLAAHEHVIEGAPSLAMQLQHVCLGLIGMPGPLRFYSERGLDTVTFTLAALGSLTLFVTFYLLLRPFIPVSALSDVEESRLRVLLDAHGGRDSLGYFALRRDRGLVWSRTGKAAVSYRVVSGVMLAAGDPLGDPEAWPGAIEVFQETALQHAWIPAVIGASERAGEVWMREAGLEVLEFGDEAVVEVASFGLGGRRMRNVRQMVNRIERAGYTTAVRRVRDIGAEEAAVIRHSAETWRDGPIERGFSMALGRLGRADDGDCVAVTAYREGRLCALLHFVPWGRDGLSLDLMRRDRSADPGLNELLIVAALRAAPALGITRLSLNFAFFRASLERGQRMGAGPVARLQCRWLLFLSRWTQIESLYRFNAKFAPVWEPRFVCYPGAADLPRVAVAMLRAEGFLPGFRRRGLQA